MGETSEIGWTNATWNPWMGCSRVSPGCLNCYMFTGMRKFGRTPEVVQRTSKQTFNAPLRWKEPKLIFTCSWSDFFHKDADQWREDAWEIILATPWHTYQILTKRPGRAVAWAKTHPFPDNVWIGTSIESQKYAPRIDVLARIPAKVRFVSCEPLLERLNLSEYLVCDDPFAPGFDFFSPERFPVISWVIDGGESGPNRRPANPEWFRSLRDQCLEAGIPYFHKQGNDFKPGQDRVLDGRTWDEMPEVKSHATA